MKKTTVPGPNGTTQEAYLPACSGGADAVRYDLGVMDGRDHGADQRGRANDREQRAYASDHPADEQREGKRRDEPGPRSHERL